LITLCGSAQGQNPQIFKDLRTYYNVCGLIAKDDPKFDACNPPHIHQIMSNFQNDPKNVEDMKKISRFHMTHSLQAYAKTSLISLYTSMYAEKVVTGRFPTGLKKLKEAWVKNHLFVITLPPSCRPASANSLELGQTLETPSLEHTQLIKETIKSLNTYPCPKANEGFIIFAVGVVDPSEKVDVWMMNEKKEMKQIRRSNGRTPFDL
jgi:hypothetical protein